MPIQFILPIIILYVYAMVVFNKFINIFIDADVIKREEEAIKIDELNVAQIKELREKVSFYIV